MPHESIYGSLHNEVRDETSELERHRVAQQIIDDWVAATKNTPEAAAGLMSVLQKNMEAVRTTHNESYTVAQATELLDRVNKLTNVPENVKTQAANYLAEVITEHKIV